MTSYKGMQFLGETTAEHSRRMSAVRSRGNKTTELRVASILKSHRLTGWRRHYPIRGSPDFVFPANASQFL